MGRVSFDKIQIGQKYDRHQLAEIWGYDSYQGFGKGVFTPSGQKIVVLLLTLEHRPEDIQYEQTFNDGILTMEGERGHKSDQRLANSRERDSVHLFLRQSKKEGFTYYGYVELIAHDIHLDKPSVFVFTTLKELAESVEQAESEGEKRQRISTYYERSAGNRAAAIRHHGTSCLACGFNFDRFYGSELAQSYIEIHHTVSITEIGGRVVDPKMELIPLCSNCHSVAHRKSGKILSLDELVSAISENHEFNINSTLFTF